MNTDADAPPVESPLTAETTTTVAWGVIGVITGIFVLAYMFAFHFGAAYLSYQKFGSILWAILDFFFPYFYYPYYAFALSGPSQPTETMLGGARRRAIRSRGFRRL